ncbi:hypothetical protein P7K49_021731 [Saguinus oedipus]|uniref:Uncharacterized protein n=1 Tax=Saguinus oedipus TaxID=9490 RepID=A0ABQ9UTG1_SAGOE|nr:hypothetical protein P7K49_021731 [Saguinus oedipus]
MELMELETDDLKLTSSSTVEAEDSDMTITHSWSFTRADSTDSPPAPEHVRVFVHNLADTALSRKPSEAPEWDRASAGVIQTGLQRDGLRRTL